jgi:hypothetical protein
MAVRAVIVVFLGILMLANLAVGQEVRQATSNPPTRYMPGTNISRALGSNGAYRCTANPYGNIAFRSEADAASGFNRPFVSPPSSPVFIDGFMAVQGPNNVVTKNTGTFALIFDNPNVPNYPAGHIKFDRVANPIGGSNLLGSPTFSNYSQKYSPNAAQLIVSFIVHTANCVFVFEGKYHG